MRFQREGVAFTMLASLPLLLFAAQDQPTISVNVDLVVLHATVRDRRGGFASGLAYRILEAGYRLQVPRMFAALVLLSLTGIALNLALGALTRLVLRNR